MLTLTGTSPHLRGNLGGASTREIAKRDIPALTGEPFRLVTRGILS